MALTTVSSDRLSTNVKNTNFTSAEKQDLTDDILPLAGQLGNRNKVINGSAIVSQRGSNTVIGVADGGFFCADRFKHVINDIGGYTIHHEADAPSGFSHSHKVQTTTADTSLGSSSVYMIRYIFEGQDVQDFAKGTSDAKQYALSFYVKTSNFTGTFVVELIDPVNTRHCCKSYTVSSAGSWQKVELIFPADTTGALTSDNAGRFEMNFYIGAGSGYTSGTLQTTWGGRSGDANRAAGQTAQIGSSTSNRFQITGVQLEVGSVATDFEHRSLGQELALCQRYYQQLEGAALSFNSILIGSFNTGTELPSTRFLVGHMRAAPSVTISSTMSDYDIEPFDEAPSSLALRHATIKEICINVNSPTSRTVGFYAILSLHATGALITISAEL